MPELTSYPIDACDAVSWTFDAGKSMIRTSTAIKLDDGCLAIDPVDGAGVDELLATLGPVIGVVTLLDRHGRDGKALAERHGCPMLVPSTLAGSGDPLVIPGIQERAILAAPGWNESSLWLPERSLLVSAEALGTASFFLADDSETLGVHPFLRLRPPTGAYRDLEPSAIAVGHGAPLRDNATAALQHALSTARSGLPKAVWHGIRTVAGRRHS